MRTFDEYLIDRFNSTNSDLERDVIQFVQEWMSDEDSSSFDEYDAKELLNELMINHNGGVK